MTGSNNNFYYWIELVAALKSTGGTGTYYLSERNLNVTLSDTEIEHFPIIKKVSGFGADMNNYMPRAIRGSITLDVSPHSYGHQRRFYDLLERYTFNNQSITFKYIFVSDGGTVVPASATTWLTATVGGYTYNRGTEELELQIESMQIPRRAVNKVINTDDFPNAPNSSIGRALPVTFGDGVEVKAYSIDNNDDWAYATTLSTEHPVGGVNDYYIKCHSGFYYKQSMPSTAATVVYGETAIGGFFMNSGEEFSLPIPDTESTAAYILRAGYITFQGYNLSGTGTTTGEWQFKLYATDRSTGLPLELLDTVIVTKSSYSSNISNHLVYFDVDFTFNKPHALDLNRFSYSIGVTDTTANGFNRIGLGTAATQAIFYKDGNTLNGWSPFASSTNGGCGFYAVKFTDTTSTAGDENGHGYAYITGSSTTPPINNLDIVLDIAGITDDTSGTFTGASFGEINETNHALAIITQQWNGSSWGSSLIDVSTYAAHHSNTFGSEAIELAGKTEGRTSLIKLCEDLCRSTFARLGNTSNGITLYSYGTIQTSQGRITHADASILRVSEQPADTSILNYIFMIYYKKVIIDNIETLINDGSFNNFASTSVFDSNTSQAYSDIIGVSETLYGKRELGDNVYNWIIDSRSAGIVAEYLFRTYARYPVTIVEFEVPFINFTDLDIFQVWEMTHPDLPAFFGTSYGTDPESYDGARVSKGGEEEFRAQKYRIFIEGRQLIFGQNKAPTVRVKARILFDDLEAV